MSSRGLKRCDLARLAVIVWLLCDLCLSATAFAQRGMLDDEPERGRRSQPIPEKPATREVPNRSEAPARREGPSRGMLDEMPMPKTTADLNGCWQSESGELDAYSSSTNRKTGTYRICFCFRSGGIGEVSVVFTSYVSRTSSPLRTCRTALQAIIERDHMLMTYKANAPCSDGLRWNPNHDDKWKCKADANGKAICDHLPPGDPRREGFRRISEDLCGWRR